MSALGDYIHYHQQNYINWGTNRINTEPSEDWSAALSNFRNQLNVYSQMNQLMAEAEALEKQYNQIFYPTQQTDETIKVRNALEQAAQEMLEEKFGLMAGKFNSSNLAVDTTKLYSDLEGAVKKTRESIKIEKLKKDSSLKQMNEAIKKIEDLLKDENIQKVSQIKDEIETAKTKVSDIKTTLENLGQDMTAGKFQYKTKNEDIETLNKIIQEFNRMPSLGGQSGDVFEWLLPVVGINLSALGKEELAKAIKEKAAQSVQGDSYFTADMPDLLNDKIADIDILQNKVEIKTISTRNKTDVVISYTDDKNTLQTANVSAKNLIDKKVEIVNDTNLYKILLFSNSYSFANHYLNIITTSAKGGGSNSTQIQQANKAVKELILKLSVEGYDSNNLSELLIINNKKESHIYVYNIKVLIYKIQQAMDKQNKYSNLINNFSDDYSINQDFESTKEIRIKNILKTIQQVRISASLNASALKQYTEALET